VVHATQEEEEEVSVYECMMTAVSHNTAITCNELSHVSDVTITNKISLVPSVLLSLQYQTLLINNSCLWQMVH